MSRKKLIQIIISFILLVIILNYVDFYEIKSIVRSANYYLIFVAFLLAFLNRILMPFKWGLLLRVKSSSLSFLEMVKIYFVSSFLGFFLPPTIGQDAIRTYYASRKGALVSDVFSSIIIERYLGLVVTVAFCLFGCFIMLKNFGGKVVGGGLFYLIAIIFIIFVLLFIFSFKKTIYLNIYCYFKNNYNKKYWGRIFRIFNQFYKSYYKYRKKKIILILFLILTIIEITITVMRSYVISLSFGVDVPLIFFFSFVPIILFFIRLPFSFDGFGIHEGGYIYFLSLYSVSSSVSFTIGSLSHFMFILLLLPGWYIYSSDNFYVLNISQE